MKNKFVSVITSFPFVCAIINFSVGMYYFLNGEFKSAAIYFIGSTVIGMVSMFE